MIHSLTCFLGVPADAEAWLALGIDRQSAVDSSVNPVREAAGDSPAPTREELQVLLRQRAGEIDWALQLQNATLSAAIAGVTSLP